jgi:hypothetical protein
MSTLTLFGRTIEIIVILCQSFNLFGMKFSDFLWVISKPIAYIDVYKWIVITISKKIKWRTVIGCSWFEGRGSIWVSIHIPDLFHFCLIWCCAKPRTFPFMGFQLYRNPALPQHSNKNGIAFRWNPCIFPVFFYYLFLAPKKRKDSRSVHEMQRQAILGIDVVFYDFKAISISEVLHISLRKGTLNKASCKCLIQYGWTLVEAN